MARTGQAARAGRFAAWEALLILMIELIEEFRNYAIRGGQVFVSTHSPDFVNGAQLNEIFWLVKDNGFTVARRASDDVNLVALAEAGDQPGALWKQGLFTGADPA